MAVQPMKAVSPVLLTSQFPLSAKVASALPQKLTDALMADIDAKPMARLDANRLGFL
jgi:hypothetical protein